MYKLFLIIPLAFATIPILIIFYCVVKSILTDTLIISKYDDDEISDEDLEILNKINNKKKGD